MTIRHLRIFMAVYTTRNMTESAKQLYMTQPSVSQAIREMEENYGVVFFERLHRQLYPTFAADTLYSYAGKIVDLFHEMEQEVNGESMQNQIRVGANYTVGASMMGGFIKELQEDEPEALVTVSINKGSVLKEMLRKNELDLVLIEEQKKEPDLIQENFASDRVVAVVPPDHPLLMKKKVAAKDLMNEKLLMREQGAGTRDQFEEAMRKAGFSIKPFWEGISVTALISAVKDFNGVAILPFESVKKELESGGLVELTISNIELTRHLAFVYHKDKYVTKIMSEFMDIVRSS